MELLCWVIAPRTTWVSSSGELLVGVASVIWSSGSLTRRGADQEYRDHQDRSSSNQEARRNRPGDVADEGAGKYEGGQSPPGPRAELELSGTFPLHTKPPLDSCR